MCQWSFPSFVFTSKELFTELECKIIYFHTYCLKVTLSKTLCRHGHGFISMRQTPQDKYDWHCSSTYRTEQDSCCSVPINEKKNNKQSSRIFPLHSSWRRIYETLFLLYNNPVCLKRHLQYRWAWTYFWNVRHMAESISRTRWTETCIHLERIFTWEQSFMNTRRKKDQIKRHKTKSPSTLNQLLLH